MASVVSIIEQAFTLAKYIYDAGKGMKENAHECKQLSKHATLVLKMLKDQAAHTTNRKTLPRIVKLHE